MGLKCNVENLVSFFRNILTHIEQTLLTLRNFVSPIKTAIDKADKNGAEMKLTQTNEWVRGLLHLPLFQPDIIANDLSLDPSVCFTLRLHCRPGSLP